MRCFRNLALLFIMFTPLVAGDASANPPAPDEGLATIRDLLQAGRYAEAERAAREQLVQLGGSDRADTVEAARVINLLVEAMWRGGKAKNPEARALAERSLSIMERSHGRQSAEAAESLNVLGKLSLVTGDYPGGRALLEEALAIREKVLAPDDIAVSRTLGNLASALALMGDYDAAVPLAERSLAIAEQKLDPSDPDLADAAGNLASLEHDMGNFEKARPLYERALQIAEKRLGPDHARVAKFLNDLGNLLADTGDNEGAKPLYQRALAISERVLGPEHPDTANYLNNLAIVLQDTGDLAGARPLYERALSVYEKALGPDHPKVGLALTNLGSIIYAIGDYAAAQPLLERALAIREKSLGPEHVDVASSLANLAGNLQMLGDLKKARPLLERAVAIKEKALGPDNASLAFTLHDYAILLREMGEYGAAEKAAQRVLAIWSKSLGPGHPMIAEALGSLAEIRMRTGDYPGAKDLFERAHAIADTALGPTHPRVLEGSEQVAQVDWAMGNRDAALEQSLNAGAIAREDFRRLASILSEREALSYQRLQASALDVAFSAMVAAGGAPSASLARAWDEKVRSRARVLDEMAQRHRMITQTQDPEVSALATRLRTARSQLARSVVSGTEQESAEEYRKALAAAQEEEEGAERALAAKSEAFRAIEARGSVGLTEVARSLPSDSALIAYVLYGRLGAPGNKTKGRSASLDRTPSYLALVLSPGHSEPFLVILGPEREINARIGAWRDAVSAAPRGLAQAGDRGEARYRQAGEALRRSVWDPVSKYLKGAQRVFVVPDGALSLVSLSTLPAEGNRYLVETGPVIHYLSAERDLVRDGRSDGSGRGLLVLGGPDFDADPGADSSLESRAVSKVDGESAPDESPPPGPGRGKATFRGERSACAAFRSLQFQPLPASRTEAMAIGALWTRRSNGNAVSSPDVIQLLGRQAAEAEFKQRVPGHRIVHMATHGFFVDDRCSSALDLTIGDQDGGRRSRKGAPWDKADNPLLLTGLALAGANRREEAGDGEDGILTAEEIASLDLSGVEWAVLSACETGLGRVQAGEGVLGLRRAFQIAGASTLIMSLWPVEDNAALQWMEQLYEGRLGGLSTDMAVREASLKMIESRRKAGRSTHPFCWGAFVAAGDWK